MIPQVRKIERDNDIKSATRKEIDFQKFSYCEPGTSSGEILWKNRMKKILFPTWP